MTERATDPLSSQFWQPVMGTDLPKTKREVIQPVRVKDGRIRCSAGHVRSRHEPGTEVGFGVQEGRILLAEVPGGVEVRDGWQGHYEFELPADVRAALSDAELLPGSDALPAMLVDGDGRLELVSMRVEEYGPDALGPRVIDELLPGVLVRHVVKGFAYDELTPERLRQLEDATCAVPFVADPVGALVRRDDWIGWKVRCEILGQPAPG